MSGILEFLYNLLPDFSGILLAAVGVALVVYPEAIKSIEHRKVLRWVIAVALFGLGVAGMRSSFVQHKDGDQKQLELSSQVKGLRTTVNTYGPKLDQIISETDPTKRRVGAIDLQRRITTPSQTLQNLPEDDPVPQIKLAATIGGPLTFNRYGVFLRLNFKYSNLGQVTAHDLRMASELYIPQKSGLDPFSERDRFCHMHEQPAFGGRIGAEVFPTDTKDEPWDEFTPKSDVDGGLQIIDGKTLPIAIIVCASYSGKVDLSHRHMTEVVYQLKKKIPGETTTGNWLSDVDVAADDLVIYPFSDGGVIVK